MISSMNKLDSLQGFTNRYFAMRHGHSHANRRRLIVSQASYALDGFGLTAIGCTQVEIGLDLVAQLGASTRILSSDFLRARKTAEIVHQRLGCGTELAFDPRLRERDFGEFELTSDDNYEAVWRQDEAGVEGGWRGVEGPGQVMARVTSLIEDCENLYRGETLLLVSHGDVLQILLTAFAGEEAAFHRRQPHLQTGEIRELHPRQGAAAEAASKNFIES